MREARFHNDLVNSYCWWEIIMPRNLKFIFTPNATYQFDTGCSFERHSVWEAAYSLKWSNHNWSGIGIRCFRFEFLKNHVEPSNWIFDLMHRKFFRCPNLRGTKGVVYSTKITVLMRNFTAAWPWLNWGVVEGVRPEQPLASLNLDSRLVDTVCRPWLSFLVLLLSSL